MCYFKDHLKRTSESSVLLFMEALIFILGASLTYWMIIAPCWKAQHARIAREYDEVYHAYRLRMVRRFYPDVRHLSFRELEDNFDIQQAFDRIGNFSPRSRNR